MNLSNRRKSTRLRIDRSVLIPVQIFPVMPFVGETVVCYVVNISAGGMALVIDRATTEGKIKKGTKLKVHFRLPGRPLSECRGTVHHHYYFDENTTFIGIRFSKISSNLAKGIEEMAHDNDLCDRRLHEEARPWCDTNCSFISLCRKPIRIDHGPTVSVGDVEIAFQSI